MSYEVSAQHYLLRGTKQAGTAQVQSRRLGVKIAVGLLACLSAASTVAEEPRKLDALVITASGHEQEAVSAPASISVIGQEQLEEEVYFDVTDALRDVPGVIVTGGGSGDRGADISMRGLPAAYTLMLVDGKRQSSRESRPNGSAGFEQDWLPPLQAIERIEVVRGPMSTLYGSDAIGGVVNVITRKVPEQWGGNLQADTIIQENRDSGDIQQSNFYIGGPIKTDKVGLQIYGRTYTREEDNIINGYEEKDLQSFTGRLAVTPTKDHDVIIEAGTTDQRRRSFVGVSGQVEGCRGGCTDSDSDHNRRHYSLSHAGRWQFGTTDSYVQRETTENVSRQMEITNTVAKSTLVKPLETSMLTLGASYEKQELNDLTSNQISDRTYVEGSKWAVFAENERMLLEDVMLTLGVRMDDDENYGSHFSPRIYGVWQLAPQWTVKGGVSTGFRSPDLREITPDWGQTSRGGDVYGNPDLQPETSLNKEIGVHYTRGNLTSGFTVFHNDFEDKITRVVCPEVICPAGPNQFGSNPTYRINVDEAVTRGVEATVTSYLTDALRMTASYTHTDSEQKSGEYAGNPLTQLPKNLLSASLNWKATANFTPWLKLTYRGEESQPVEGPSQSALVAPSYTFVDSGLGYRLTEQATINVGVYNMFDEEVTYEEYGLVEDGRRYWLGLNVDF